MTIAEVKRLRVLEKENQSLKKTRSGSIIRHSSSQGCSLAKVVAPQAKRACSKVLIEEYRLSKRGACQLVGASRATVRYRSQKGSHEALKRKIHV